MKTITITYSPLWRKAGRATLHVFSLTLSLFIKGLEKFGNGVSWCWSKFINSSVGKIVSKIGFVMSMFISLINIGMSYPENGWQVEHNMEVYNWWFNNTFGKVLPHLKKIPRLPKINFKERLE